MANFDPLRWVEDIGMFAMDRPISDTPKTATLPAIAGSCVHKTTFCAATCYNNKLYKLYPRMHSRDASLENWWQTSPNLPLEIRDFLSRKKKNTTRVRFMTRGEALKDAADIVKVLTICQANPEVTFWLPTRAWRDPQLRKTIQRLLFPVKNLALNASMDPSNTPAEWASLKKSGWSFMFYGDDTMTTTPNGDRMFLCPKTHKKDKGHCGICKAGCFGQRTSYGKRTDVHLSKH